MYGQLTKHSDASDIRTATLAELRESLLAAMYDGGSGVFTGPDGVACYVSGETIEGRAEALGLAAGEVADWPPRGEQRERVAAHVGRMARHEWR